ncbi:MAG: arylsulfotransferase family protein [Pseudomonadota bacterium]
MNTDRLAALISIAAAAMLSLGGTFAGGFVVAHKELWPYTLLVDAGRAVRSTISTGSPEGNRYARKFLKAGAQGRWETSRPQEMLPGFYAVLGYDIGPGNHTMRLFSSSGDLVSTIDVNQALDMTDRAIEYKDPHGFALLADGSIMVNFDRLPTLARIDACGEVMWRNEALFHHSIELTDRNTAWTWRGEPDAYSMAQFMDEVDVETGTILRSISMEDVVLSAGSKAAFLNRAPVPFPTPLPPAVSDGAGDAFHPNDVEELSASMADAFPNFEAGDLLISLKTTDVVAVIDPLDASLKWLSRGPWSKQHDPDFMPDGRISVFDNNSNVIERAKVTYGPSAIVEIDPETNEVRTILNDGDTTFLTPAQGTHQRLPNGNVLVVVPHEGRMIEYNGAGEVVAIFNNVDGEEGPRTFHMSNARWVPADYFVDAPSCFAEKLAAAE